MSDTVISVEGLSKRFLIGHDGPQESYSSLRDTMVRHGKNFARKTLDMARGRQIVQGDSVEEFWALKDVSFEVKRGEVLGIIGRNGAGKSTLLKVLSRITEPTEGRVTLNGRVASLLEVGTGFHPELTGRENILLNGAILGMTRAEIRAKFDEIVDFAGVEKFLDTPVKRYSSGMYVRLAFAVAAHLEPEILIVDEVLAVGDVEFQKKCLGKMKDVAEGGRTVLFVSHNLGAVRELCHHAVWLNKGQIERAGSVGSIVSSYLRRDQGDSRSNLTYSRSKASSALYHITEAAILNDDSAESFDANRGLNLAIYTNVPLPNDTCLGVKVENEHGAVLLNTTTETALWRSASGSHPNPLYLAIPPHVLRAGLHSFTFYVGKRGYEAFDRVENALCIEFVEGPGPHGVDTSSWPGLIHPAVLKWEETA